MFQIFIRQIAVSLLCVTIGLTISTATATSPDRPLKIVALGDSLTTGLGLPRSDAFPAKLTQALATRGYKVEITDAGVSGDTASGGLARLDWSVPADTDAVILELGANDMLRGFDPKLTRSVLEQILTRLTARHIPVLLCGIRAAPNLGEDYTRAFNPMFSELAAKFAAEKVLLYPFFLDGVAADPKLNQADGHHPNAAGVSVIVARILPKIEELIARVHARNPS